MIYNTVIYDGEQYCIVGEAIAEYFNDAGEVIMFPVVLLSKLERRAYKPLQGAIWVHLAKVSSLPSNVDYRLSEWTIGLAFGGLNEN